MRKIGKGWEHYHEVVFPIWQIYCVKKYLLQTWTVILSHILNNAFLQSSTAATMTYWPLPDSVWLIKCCVSTSVGKVLPIKLCLTATCVCVHHKSVGGEECYEYLLYWVETDPHHEYTLLLNQGMSHCMCSSLEVDCTSVLCSIAVHWLEHLLIFRNVLFHEYDQIKWFEYCVPINVP